ncbi:tail protein X [Phaeobacter inhibens]|uniref:tail protein X n=1 Tax=Phaeobacter inhibens TaxID=221822 RepID=UPI000C9C2FD7|nr:tail protein X [Phaeobacter inhibens]AUQ65158.1 Phage Tail Protein X [Phaeobacter inhibens]
MASEYVTGANDALDLICLREYGAQAGVVEQVLEANLYIRDVAHALPSGVTIALPDLAGRSGAAQSLKLWD